MIAPLDNSEGIELRDWFAGLAMHALIASGTIADEDDTCPLHVVAGTAYDLADHMLDASRPDEELN
jgi:hypothetical protein